MDVVDNLQCHNCHDVHDMNFAENDQMNGPPYLRGSWVRNPYPEDGAPLSGNDYSTGQTTQNYGPVPRGGLTYNKSGGFQIDQNNPDATKGLSLGNSAGLCTLCHGTDVDTMDYTSDNGGDGLWMTAGKNGHSNSALGGTAIAAKTSDILNFTSAGGRHTISGTPPPELTADYPDPQNPSMGYQSANIADGVLNRRIDGIRSTYNKYGFHVLPEIIVDFAYANLTTVPDPGFSWGVTQDNGTVNQGYHAFTCSKCHNPHASRLPKLLITNCLDTKQNTWDDGRLLDGSAISQGQDTSPNADNADMTLSNVTSAQNCHRLGDPGQGGTGGGWNLVTPRPKLTL
jgi:hypothetical protein